MKSVINAAATAIGAVVMGCSVPVSAVENPLEMIKMSGGYQLSSEESTGSDQASREQAKRKLSAGKCAASWGKSPEGKCGTKIKHTAEPIVKDKDKDKQDNLALPNPNPSLNLNRKERLNLNLVPFLSR